MKFLPAFAKPPFSYDGLPILTKPRGQVSFQALTNRVGMFARDGILDVGARILWGDFRDPNGGCEGGPGLTMIRTCAVPIMTLALMFGARPGKQPRPILQEFVLLCWEYFMLPTFQKRDSVAAAFERIEIRKKLAQLPASSRLRRIPSSAEDIIRAMFNLSGAAADRIVDSAAQPSDLVRDLLIYEQLRSAYGGDADGRFLAAERAFLQTTYRMLIRGAVFLLGLNTENNADTPGRVDLVEEGA